MLNLYEIEPGKLYQSAAITDTRDVFLIALKGIDAIFDLSGFFDPSLIAALPITYFHHLFYDLPLPPRTDVLAVFAFAAKLLIDDGHKVLIHCTMGRNRSSLLTGSILHLIHPDWAGAAIVDTIKHNVPEAITNKTFEKILINLKAKVL